MTLPSNRSTALALLAPLASVPAAAAQLTAAPAADSFQDAAPEGLGPTLREHVPAALREGGFAGLETWQWVAVALLILAGLALDVLLQPLLRLLLRRLAGRQGRELEDAELRRSVRPWGFVAAALLWLGGLHALDLAGLAQTVLVNAARIYLTLVSVLAFWRAVDLAGSLLAARAARTASRVDDVLVPLLRRAGKIFVAAVGVVYVADGLSLDVAPLLASLGIGGLAFAFAAKDTIENFFGSIAVLTDQPFLVGDWVVIGEVEGTVERIGFRSTRVRTFYDSMVTVPNATLVRAQVDNYGRRRYRRIKTTLQLSYATPPEKVLAFVEGVRELLRTHPFTRKDYFQVWLKDLGASSLDVLLYCFVETPDWTTELRERERLLLDVLRLAERLGVEIAYPTQTLHLRRGEDLPAPPEEPAAPDSRTRRRAEESGRQAAQDLVADRPWSSEAG